jgi:hypothetical protein
MLFSKSKSTVKFFAPGGFYVYAMGSYNRFAPSQDHYITLGSGSSHAYAPLLGIGYRVVNINDRLFICLEGEYSPITYDFEDFARHQEISVFSLLLNFEGRIFSKFPLLVFGGIGVGFHGLSDLGYENDQGDYILVGNDTVSILVLDMGIKVPISRFLFIRSEFQWNTELYTNREYYNDYWVHPWDIKWDFLHSSALSMGLEIHF